MTKLSNGGVLNRKAIRMGVTGVMEDMMRSPVVS